MIYILAALFLAFVMALWKREPMKPTDIYCGLLIGFPNYYFVRVILLALGKVPAIMIYSAYSAGTIITIVLMGMAVSRENLSRQKIGALILIVVALVLQNISKIPRLFYLEAAEYRP